MQPDQPDPTATHVTNLQPLQPQPAITNSPAPSPNPAPPTAVTPSPGHTTPPPHTPPRPPTPTSFTTPHKLLRRNHFWHVLQDDNKVTTTHGKGTGPKGRSTTREFKTEQLAAAWCESTWQEKTAQGYVLEKDYVKGSTPTPTPVKRKKEEKEDHQRDDDDEKSGKLERRTSRKRVRPEPFAPPASPKRGRGRGRGRARGMRGMRGRGRGAFRGGRGGGAPGVLKGGARKRRKGIAPVLLTTETAYDVQLVKICGGVDETVEVSVRVGEGGILFTHTVGETGREGVTESIEYTVMDDAVTKFKAKYKEITNTEWSNGLTGGGNGWRVVKRGLEKGGKWLYERDGWCEFADESKILERLHAEYQCNTWLRERFVWSRFGGVVVNLEDMTVSLGGVKRRVRREVKEDGDMDGETDIGMKDVMTLDVVAV